MKTYLVLHWGEVIWTIRARNIANARKRALHVIPVSHHAGMGVRRGRKK